MLEAMARSLYSEIDGEAVGREDVFDAHKETKQKKGAACVPRREPEKEGRRGRDIPLSWLNAGWRPYRSEWR